MIPPTVYDCETKIWHGPKKERLFGANCSLGRAALHMMRSKPLNSTCQISDSEGTTLTYDTVSAYAIRVAQHLKEDGVTQDDVVGFVAPNTTLLLPTMLGCWLNCTPIHVLSEAYDEATTRELFNITKPKYIFCDGAQYEKIKAATLEFSTKIYTLCNHVENVEKVDSLLNPSMMEFLFRTEKLKYGAEQTVAIYCTAGTSGLPKCVSISNEALCNDFDISRGSSVSFSFSSPCCQLGLIDILSNMLKGGTRIITTKPFTPEYTMKVIAKYKVNLFSGSPELMTALSQSACYTKNAMQSVRIVTILGGYCSSRALKRLRAQLTNSVLIYFYSCMEFGGIAYAFSGEKLKSVGHLSHNVELKIVNVESGERLGSQEIGEICVKNDCKWLGYYHDEAMTKQVMDFEGWIRTGDMGYMDEESSLFLVDRCKDILKYRGIHFSPVEIEETIAQLPDVLDVCVFGVNSENNGDLAAAAIVKRADSTLSATQITQYVAQQQGAKHKHINYGVFFLPQLVRNANGKILRNEIKELCLNMKKSNND